MLRCLAFILAAQRSAGWGRAPSLALQRPAGGAASQRCVAPVLVTKGKEEELVRLFKSLDTDGDARLTKVMPPRQPPRMC